MRLSCCGVFSSSSNSVISRVSCVKGGISNVAPVLLKCNGSLFKFTEISSPTLSKALLSHYSSYCASPLKCINVFISLSGQMQLQNHTKFLQISQYFLKILV